MSHRGGGVGQKVIKSVTYDINETLAYLRIAYSNKHCNKYLQKTQFWIAKKCYVELILEQSMTHLVRKTLERLSTNYFRSMRQMRKIGHFKREGRQTGWSFKNW